MTDEVKGELNRISRELKNIREMIVQAALFTREAESEIPEKMRRFSTYMHDIHDIKYMYESQGHGVPKYIMQELERCDDRYRQLLNELHTDGGAFEKVRREMAKDTENKWDHTRLLSKPNGATE